MLNAPEDHLPTNELPSPAKFAAGHTPNQKRDMTFLQALDQGLIGEKRIPEVPREPAEPASVGEIYTRFKKLNEDRRASRQAKANVEAEQRTLKGLAKALSAHKLGLEVALGTTGEKAALEGIARVREQAQASEDRLDALNSVLRNMPKENQALEGNIRRALLSRISEIELEALPVGALECLHRSWSAYQGGCDWESFLGQVFPQPTRIEGVSILGSVLKSHGVSL